MSKHKKKKGSSRPRPKVPGTSQFARFSSASVSLPTRGDSSGSSAAAAIGFSSDVSAAVSSAPSQAIGSDACSSPPDLASPDLKTPIAMQVDISLPGNSLVGTIGTSVVAIEAVAFGLASQQADAGSLSHLSSAPSTEKAMPALDKKWSSLLKDELEEVGSPSQHITGVPFVLIPDENIEAAKDEFKDFIFAQFHGNYPEMGRVIGVVNALWART